MQVNWAAMQTLPEGEVRGFLAQEKTFFLKNKLLPCNRGPPDMPFVAGGRSPLPRPVT